MQDFRLTAFGVFPSLRGEDNHLDVEQTSGGLDERQRIVLVKQKPLNAVATPGLGAKIMPQRSGGEFNGGLCKFAKRFVEFVFHVKSHKVNLRDGVKRLFHRLNTGGGVTIMDVRAVFVPDNAFDDEIVNSRLDHHSLGVNAP